MIGQYWIARDADGSLALYNYRPAFIRADEIIEYDHFGFAGSDQRYTFGDRPIVKELPKDLFPEVAFERSPIQLTVGGLL